MTTVTMMHLSSQVKALQEQHKETTEMAARSILHALDLKDKYTFGHSMRVAFYALAVGKEMGLSAEELYKLELASLFHDVGKIGIPDSILLKPARLNEEEFQVMKTHPSKSAEILKGFKDFDDVAQFALHHHERFDGRGYPDGLKGEDIPFFSRIILICDTYDAMTSTRPYRKGLDHEIAFEELEQFAGTQFDPYIVKAFVKSMRQEDSKNEDSFYLPIMEEKFLKDAA